MGNSIRGDGEVCVVHMEIPNSVEGLSTPLLNALVSEMHPGATVTGFDVPPVFNAGTGGEISVGDSLVLPKVETMKANPKSPYAAQKLLGWVNAVTAAARSARIAAE